MLVDRGFDEKKIFIIYNGINFDNELKHYPKEDFFSKYKIQPEEDEILVGIAARFNPVKGIDTLIDAASIVAKNNPRVKFLIGGDGEADKSLRAQAQRLHLEDTVFFLGWIDNSYQFISNVDISVLTSISESFPYSILEGTRYSKPTISSRVGGIPDLIDDGVNGYLFEPRDHNTLAEKILALASDPDKMRNFGNAIFKKASENFSLGAMCKTQLNIYDEILKSSKSIAKTDNKSFDVIISGYYGFGNIGDDAMLRSIIDNLKLLKPDISIAVLSRRPERTSENYNVFAVNRLNILSVIKVMKKAKLFIYGGGNIIQDSTSSRSLMFYLGTAWLAKILRLKVMFYANGIGPINRRRNLFFSKIILNSADAITVREHISYNELKRMGISNPKVSLTADAALSVHIIDTIDFESILQSEDIPQSAKYAGFAVRKCPGAEKEDTKEKYEQVIADTADYVYEKYNLLPLFVPMEYPLDLTVIKRIVSKMKNKGYILQKSHSVSEIFTVIKKMDIMISMRLHALIFAANLNVPLLGISYQPKVDGFLDYISQPCAGNIKNISIEKTKEEIDRILMNSDSIKKELAVTMAELIKKANENPEIAIKLITT
jgi:polysaccharide pyruvyl transferase CsaB